MLLPTEIARRQPNGLQVRPDAVRVSWTLDDLPAADGHALRVQLSCGMRAVDDPADRQMMATSLLAGRSSLTIDDLRQFFAPTVRAAAAASAREKGIEAWLSGADKDSLAAVLKTAIDRVAFSCGLEVLPPIQLDLESPSYEQKRLKDLQRTLAEQEAAGRVEHFNRAVDLLKRFEEAREKAPDLTPGTLLSKLSPADQGATLQTLLLASARNAKAQELWAVGGEYLVRIDARNGSTPKVDLIPLPPTLGPLRSVQSAHIDGESVLLVGARNGFYLVRPADPGNAEAYPDLGVESALGFSRVVFHNREQGFAACHGDAGLVRWTYAHTHGPSSVTRPERFGGRPAGITAPPPVFPSTAGSIQGSMQASNRAPGPRNLQALDERRLLLSVGPALWVATGDNIARVDYSASPAEVVTIVSEGAWLRIVHDDGTIATVDTRSLATIGSRRRPMKVRAATSLPWLGSTRILLAGDDGAVQCVGTEDSIVSEYASNHRGLRVLAASADLVAGVSADRQRLVLWHTWDGRQPAHEVYLTAQMRHRIADVEFC